ncbi:hypothetical protein SEPCBS119000_005783 [Sporothrix epigloea]|uniref:CCZ1/INTU/HSP4 first Longin domain-containing protein n=1 Tax=Sporothrix epigloea TaxID=1892477 RepID=A0ABP0DZP1_9PEZI
MPLTERATATTGSGETGKVAGVSPARLGFLAIYNPSLGTTDDTVDDQIVYYSGAPVDTAKGARDSSASRRRRGSASPAKPAAHLAQDERNERLRQIGLAQGMVAFGRSFADDQAVDTIETEKTRVVLHELEPGWWMLASVDLTRLPAAEAAGSSDGTASTTATAVEYSAREVKPAALLLQDLLRAHSVFLLHHDVSLEALFHRVTTRSRFTALLARYWDVFLSSWSVMLHGNPARDVLPGIRLAASGELGIGVGEEERGSGEREVLEGLIESCEGLVDLVVCKYGDLSLQEAEGWSSTGQADKEDADADTKHSESSALWLGKGNGLGAKDGAIFLGRGALSRQTLRTLTYWMEDVYCWGHDAYGIAESSTAPTRQSRRRKRAPQDTESASDGQNTEKGRQLERKMAPPPSLLPPPPVTQLSARAGKPSTPASVQTRPTSTVRTLSSPSPDTASQNNPSGALSETAGGMDRYMSIMKLGYGTYWGRGNGSSSDSASDDAAKHASDTLNADSDPKRLRFHNERQAGKFLISLVDKGNEESKLIMEHELPEHTDQAIPKKPNRTAKPTNAPPRIIFASRAKSDARCASRGTQCGVVGTEGTQREASSQAADDATTEIEKLRVVVYAQQPFLYTFLFEEKQDNDPANSDGKNPTLADEKVIQTLIDRQLSILHKPLLSSTAYRPDKPGMVRAAALLNAAAAPSSSSSTAAPGSIYDLVWDPNLLTIHSTIPNIPEPKPPTVNKTETKDKLSSKRELAQRHKSQQQQNLQTKPPPPQPPWSRVEALNTHMQLLNVYAATRNNGAELERMCKTSRGWWIVWNRLLDRSEAKDSGPRGQCKCGSTLLEEDEEEDVAGDHTSNLGDSELDDGAYQRAPSDCDSDATATVQASSTPGTYTVRKEIILIRKASDHASNASSGGAGRLALGPDTSSSSGSVGGFLGMGRASTAVRAFSAGAYLGFGTGSRGSGSSAAGRAYEDAALTEAAAAAGDRDAGWTDGASRLAQGIGIDTKKYIEGLLTIRK